MNWQNCEDNFEDKIPTNIDNFQEYGCMVSENEEKKNFQLNKFKDPTQDHQRQKFFILLNRFGDLVVKNSISKITLDLMTENCEAHVFNCKNKPHVLCYCINKDSKSLIEDIRVLKRSVRETQMDLDKNTAFQISNCQVYHADDGSTGEEVILEVFTFRNDKLSRYRVCFGWLTSAHGPGDPLEPTTKDKKLAKVKELNYALAGKPNIQKVAATLDVNTEYKIWSWDTKRCFTFRKNDIAAKFESLEENYSIKFIVPYEVYTEKDFVIGTYVYHLEAKSRSPEKKFLWLSNCIFAFDENGSLMKISQQGELFPEEEANIPFEVFPKSRLLQIGEEISRNLRPNFDLFYKDNTDFACNICRFGPYNAYHTGAMKGLSEINKFPPKVLLEGHPSFDWTKGVDIFIDQQDPSYDVIIIHLCAQGKLEAPHFSHKGRVINFWSMIKFSFENGKLAKMLQFFSAIPEPIPSPYDDPNFEALNVRRRGEMK